MSLNQNEISARDLPVDPQRLAFIDSRINTIQVGKGDFEDLKNKLKNSDSSIEVR